MATSKQDLVGARTAADIERKYNFGKSFAEVMGIANDARSLAEEAESSADDLDKKLTPDEIFRRLTNYGEVQGIYKTEDGQIYINADYLSAYKFVSTVETFIEPQQEEIDYLQQLILSGVTPTAQQIALYDFNGDGELHSSDLRMAHLAMIGETSLADWSGAKKSTVTLTIDLDNPEKAIHISGVNMWGRDISGYIGINGTTFPHRGTADYVVEEGKTDIDSVEWTYRKWNSGLAECWGRLAVTPTSVDFFSVTADYPFMFVTEPNVTLTEGINANVYSRLRYGDIDGQAWVNTSKVYLTFEDVTTTANQLTAYIQVIGRWK